MASVAPNKSLIDRDRLIKKLTPEQLKQLIQQNPQSTEATLALARLNELKEFSERGRGMQGEAPSMRDQLLTYNHGIGNTPMRPPSNMAMAAQGGLIGFQDRGLVEEPTYFDRFDDGFQFNDLTGFAGDLGGDTYEYVKENPGKVAAGTALTLATLPLSAPVAATAGAARLGAAGLGALARTPIGQKVAQKVGQYGGNFVARQGKKVTDKAKKYFEGRLKKQQGPLPTPAGVKPKLPKGVTKPKKFKLRGENESKKAFRARKEKYEDNKKKWDAHQNNTKTWQSRKDAQIKYRKDFDIAREAQRLRNQRIALGGSGAVGLLAAGSGGEEEPLITMQGLPEMGLPRGSEAIKDPKGMSMEPKKRSFLSDALVMGGLEYASNPNANIGSAAKAGVESAIKRRDQMTDREKLEFDRKTRMGVAEIGLLKARQLTPATKLSIDKEVTKYRNAIGAGYGLGSDLQRFNDAYEDPVSKIEGLNILYSELQLEPIDQRTVQQLSGGAGVEATINALVSDALALRESRRLLAVTGAI
tara:strand:- start:5615 stop:7201 length:1587 start_codon:yes stop_codon:yes gene_type:complete